MNISNVLNDVRNRILGCKDRLPLYLSLAGLASGALSLLVYLLAVIFRPINFLYRISIFLQGASVLCMLLMGIYLLIVFKKTFLIPIGVAGAAAALNVILMLLVRGNIQGFISIIYALALAYYLYSLGDSDSKTLALIGAAAPVLSYLINFIVSRFAYNLYYVAGGRIMYFLQAVTIAISLIGSIVNLSAICTASDYAGGVNDVLGPVVSKVMEKIPGRSAGTAGSAPSAAIPDSHVENAAAGAGAAAAIGAAVAAGSSNVIRSVPASSKVEIDEQTIRSATADDTSAAPVTAEMISQFSSAETTASPGKVQYKTVAGPVGLTVSKNDSFESGVKQYAAIIDAEAVGGWKLDSIYEIPVTRAAGCIDALFGRGDETVYFNMLIFYKED